jgi:chorismate dehydratase
MRIGQMKYRNAIPLYAAFPKEMLVPGCPSELNQLLRDGDVEAATISAAEYIDNQELYTLLPYCIAADGEVRSVTLYHRGPLKTIGLTSQSATSARLVRILCNKWGVDATFETCDDPTGYDAFLLIGDDALDRTFPGYAQIDLAAAWKELTGLPMVFGVVAARRDSPHIEEISDLFARSLETPVEKDDYLSLLTYHLGERERQALELFAQETHGTALS